MIEQSMDDIRAHQESIKPDPDIINSGLEDIIKGELSAVEAYEQVINEFSKDPEHRRILQFRDDHQRALDYWKKAAHISNYSESDDSGIWGKVVEGFVGAAKLIGDTTTLRALKTGEEHGLSQYKELLKDNEIALAHKQQIRSVFVPNIENHIGSLKAMIKIQ